MGWRRNDTGAAAMLEVALGTIGGHDCDLQFRTDGSGAN